MGAKLADQIPRLPSQTATAARSMTDRAGTAMSRMSDRAGDVTGSAISATEHARGVIARRVGDGGDARARGGRPAKRARKRANRAAITSRGRLASVVGGAGAVSGAAGKVGGAAGRVGGAAGKVGDAAGRAGDKVSGAVGGTLGGAAGTVGRVHGRAGRKIEKARSAAERSAGQARHSGELTMERAKSKRALKGEAKARRRAELAQLDLEKKLAKAERKLARVHKHRRRGGAAFLVLAAGAAGAVAYQRKMRAGAGPATDGPAGLATDAAMTDSPVTSGVDDPARTYPGEHTYPGGTYGEGETAMDSMAETRRP
jgi:hypothetical protein